MVMPRPRLPLTPAAISVCLFLLCLPIAAQTRDTIPSALSDRDFWSLTERLSEPSQFFQSQSGSPDNLLSNEVMVSAVAAALANRVKPGGVYLGVGPEQNFTYMAASRPRIAFITDIRRGNLHLHLMYKALFELAANRTEFVGRLFSRKLPPADSSSVTAGQLMTAALTADAIDEPAFKMNLKAISDHLTRTHGLALDADDLAGIEYVYRNFYRFGPSINYTSSINGRGGAAATYAQLMRSTDPATGERSYLASESSFGFVKALESKNLIVPIVGDFAGPKALRSLGAYLKERSAVVGAFYVSNVEDYLRRNGVWQAFCANIAAMPLDEASTFIRPAMRPPLGAMAAEVANCSGK
jgi:hypothetical protein